jgi:hypothetical protein
MKIVALDDTGKALADRSAGHVNGLAFLENVNLDFTTDLDVLTFALTEAKLPQATPRLDTGLVTR